MLPKLLVVYCFVVFRLVVLRNFCVLASGTGESCPVGCAVVICVVVVVAGGSCLVSCAIVVCVVGVVVPCNISTLSDGTITLCGS